MMFCDVKKNLLKCRETDEIFLFGWILEGKYEFLGECARRDKTWSVKSVFS
jgi:hypothetical protein